MRVSPEVIAAVHHAARRAAPLEACGVLLARGEVILEAVELANRAAASHRFEMDALDLAEVERTARGAGWALAGYFHTHPDNDIVASAADRAGVTWPELPPRLHLIVSRAGAWALYESGRDNWSRVACGDAPGAAATQETTP